MNIALLLAMLSLIGLFCILTILFGPKHDVSDYLKRLSDKLKAKADALEEQFLSDLSSK